MYVPLALASNRLLICRVLCVSLGLVLDQVRRKDQRKACRCYCVLLVIYLAAMLQMTVSTFQHRRGPPTSIELIEDQAWTSPPPPNMVMT